MATLLKVLNNLADIKSAGVLHFALELRTPTWRASTGMRWAGQIATAVSAFSAIRRGSRRLGTLSQLRDAQLHRPGARLQPGDDFGDFEPRMDRPCRVVLMRAGKAKVSEYPIAKELGDEAVIAR